MIALVFEAYGALCLFALAVFLVWAAVAKLRPDLDEQGFDLAELDKLKKLMSSEPSDHALSIEPLVQAPSPSLPERLQKTSKRSVRRRSHLFHSRNPRAA